MPYLIAVRVGDASERPFHLGVGEFSVGSDPSTDITIENPSVSAREGVVWVDPGGRLLFKPRIGSTATHLSRGAPPRKLSERPDDELELECGDRIQWGDRFSEASIEILEAEPATGISMPTLGVTETDGTGYVIAKVPVQAAEILDARIRQTDSNALGTLYRMAKALQPHGHLDELLAATVDQVLGAIPAATHVAVFLADPSSERAVTPAQPAVARQRADPRHAPVLDHVVSRSVLERVERERVGILLMDAQSAFPGSESVAIGGIRSSIAVPLVVGTRWVGILQVDNRLDVNAFTEQDLAFLTVFAGHLAAILANAVLTEKLRRAEAALRRASCIGRWSMPQPRSSRY